jgi:hypothetical protein
MSVSTIYSLPLKSTPDRKHRALQSIDLSIYPLPPVEQILSFLVWMVSGN